ncbi:hypothetical protein Tco_0126566 [Tanacetum coccineum]
MAALVTSVTMMIMSDEDGGSEMMVVDVVARRCRCSRHNQNQSAGFTARILSFFVLSVDFDLLDLVDWLTPVKVETELLEVCLVFVSEEPNCFWDVHDDMMRAKVTGSSLYIPRAIVVAFDAWAALSTMSFP